MNANSSCVMNESGAKNMTNGSMTMENRAFPPHGNPLLLSASYSKTCIFHFSNAKARQSGMGDPQEACQIDCFLELGRIVHSENRRTVTGLGTSRLPMHSHEQWSAHREKFRMNLIEV